jgi:membrane protease YdiL (CAAX protease family)
MDFFCIVIISNLVITLLPSILFSIYKKVSLIQLYRFKKVTTKEMLLAICLFALSSVTALFLHQISIFIMEFIGKPFKMSTYPVATDLSSLFLLIFLMGVIPPVCEDLFYRVFY